MTLTQGTTLVNRYRIVSLLGQGGFGAVYRAWDLNLKRPCALKENLDITPEAQRQFEREATILGSLNHPNLPRVTNHFVIPGQGQYLVMDYIEGEDLEQILQRTGQLFPEEHALIWVEQICDALEYLHTQTPPIIHRDIKPANIKITPDGRAVLVDFGIAKIYDEHLRTTVGAQAVTPGYSSFEQYGHGITDARADIYSLAATLYTLLTGQVPPESITRASHDTLPPVRRLNPVVSARIESALARAMALQPTGRYARARDFKAALRQEEKIIEETEKTTGRPRWIWLLAVGIVGVCLLMGGIGYGLWQWVISQAMVTPISTEVPVVESITQSPTPSPIPSITPTSTLTPSATISPTLTISPTPEPTATPTVPPAFEWNSEVVQKSQDVGYFSSLCIDRLDNLHVGFFQDSSDILWYGHNDSGKWAFEYVLGGSGSGFHLSLALDNKNNPHIAYHMMAKKQTPEVRYVQWTGSEWKLYRLYDSYAANVDLTLALDADDQPHIVYLDGYSFNVTYVPFTSKGWEFQTVDRGSPTTQAIAMAADVFKSPHISYQSNTGSLKYATLVDGIWQRYTVDAHTDTGEFSAIALDADQKPHIAYYDSNFKILKYAYLDNETWVTLVIDDQGDVGQYPSIAVDASGGAHISYYDATNRDLKYAHIRDGQWNIYMVDTYGSVGQWNSLALDSHGIPYITYLDQDNADLKLAKAFPVTP